MGDRVSIQFQNGDEKSVVLFHHWGGQKFPKDAFAYAKKLKAERGGARALPIDRLEPNTVMVDFIREITKDQNRIESSVYLGKDEHDGDNSDNGNYIIDLVNLKLIGVVED